MTDQPPLPNDPTPPRGIPMHDLPPEAPLPIVISAPPQKVFGNPQIIAAVITGLISLAVAIVGIIPSLIKNDKEPTPTTVAAALIVTFTPSDSPLIAPSTTSAPVESPLPPATDTPEASVPTIVSVGQTTPLPVIGDTPNVPAPTAPLSDDSEPNIRIYFDNASFTIRNQTAGKRILGNIVFASDVGRWEASQWGLIHEDFKKDKCLRLRDVSTSPRTPPSDCAGTHLLALMEVGPAAIFWRDPDGFRVERSGVELGSCTASPCDLYFPPE